MIEDLKLRNAIIIQRLKELCPGALITKNLDKDYQIALESEKEHKGLNLFIQSQKETVYISKQPGERKKLIDSKLKITEVAKYYGLKVRRNKCICPFHKDTDPSLSLNDDKNVFYCFGCKATGDIIEFIRRMEDGQKTSRE